jgi:hypothetical protein
MPNRPRTISVLIERNLISLKCIAASHDRALLIDRAHYEFLHLGQAALRQLDETGKVAVSDLTDATIEEVEMLYAGEGPGQITINERTER